jgi:hypothetical protein
VAVTVAKFAQHWNDNGTSPTEFSHKRDILFAFCENMGRDPQALAPDQVESLSEVGVDLTIVYLQPPLTPSRSS